MPWLNLKLTISSYNSLFMFWKFILKWCHVLNQKCFFNKHNYGPLKKGWEDSMNVEEGGVHCKRYNGYCTK